MKEIYLDAHANSCKFKSLDFRDKFCELNQERFLFFLGTNFYLITYNICMDAWGGYDFKKWLIDKIIKENNVFELYEVDSGVDVRNDLRDFRIRNNSLKKYIQQVNYIYQDNSKKKYALTTKTKYLDAICNQDEINKNYNEAKNTLIKNNYDWLLGQLEDLYEVNKVYNENEAEYVKTIEHLINKINQLTR